MSAPLPLASTRMQNDLHLLERLAITANDIRAISIAAIYHAMSGHPGGSLSCADILAALYGAKMSISPERLADPHRDRFVLSKGHAAPALYAAGAHFRFCTLENALTLRKLGSPFQGHPHGGALSWVETSTGSLGQGFSVALGMAIGLRIRKSPARVYALLGDGELQEGEVWEAAMCAAHHKLDNLLAIIDYNKLQSDDTIANIMTLEPLAAKFHAFGWHVQEINGHDFEEILTALERTESDKPSVVIAHTVKGKGVPFMENNPCWHGSLRLTREQATESLAALGRSQSDIERLLSGTC